MKKSNVIAVWKNQGDTPLKTIELFKKNNSKFEKCKISYAGRLDPMAEGILLLLIDEENKKRKDYEGLKKEYEAEIVFGIATDTFDALGLITNKKFDNFPIKKTLKSAIKNFLGLQNQTYPPFSSKTIQGKPLYYWARKNLLYAIKLPVKEIEIYDIKLLKFEFLTTRDLTTIIKEKITKIIGDFRQSEILNKWMEFENAFQNQQILKIKIKINCSSGTYVRRLAADLGESLNTHAFALSITRISVGEYTKNDCLKYD